MVILEVILILYFSGVFGSLIGAMWFALPKNFNELDNALTIVLLWPLYVWHRYNNEIDRRSALLFKQNCKILIEELERLNRLLKVLSDNTAFQHEQYQELKRKYDRLKQQIEKERNQKNIK